MRLWHKDLISVLPRQQLLGQWRELCCIASNIKNKNSPNHLLVNKVLDYSFLHFKFYCYIVINEMKKRGYKINEEKLLKNKVWEETNATISNDDIFKDWHNERYLKQCLYNLQEKYDCGGISNEEWSKIEKNIKNFHFYLD